MRRAAIIWVFSGITVLLICLCSPSLAPAAVPGAVNPYDVIASGGASVPTSPAAPAGLYGTSIIYIPTEHVTGYVVATAPFRWDYAYDIGVSGGQVLIDLDIQLTGYDPGTALKTQWETGIEGIWSDKYGITDGTYGYPINVDVHWVTANADQVVEVFNSYGYYDMNDWYTVTDWGPDYHDEMAAHEAGHMFGLFDEYLGGATDPVNPYYSSDLMGYLGPVQERYYNRFLSWVEDRSGQDLSLEIAGASPPPPDAVIPYNFKFTYSNGDYYTGTVWAKAGYGYSPGDTWQVTDPYGSTGTYRITGAGPAGDQTEGLVYVASYYDRESRKTVTPLNSGQPLGSNYLGSEAGYLIDETVPQYYFTGSGQGIYEADMVTGKYAFTFYYGNGDYYTGAVYADPAAFKYYQGYTEAFTDENGLSGYYKITGRETGKFKPKPGQVFVDGYYDNESSQVLTPVSNTRAKGSRYLGSETGYIYKSGVSYLKFGGGYWEADPAAKYTFSFYYGNGDYYDGWVYAFAGDYQTGGSYFLDNNETTPATGNQGYYQITGTELLGYTRYLGQVFVTNYYDAETLALYTPASQSRRAAGRDGLGSEYDWIVGPDRLRKNTLSPYYFGGGFYEADLQ
ncbi:MAG: hypothetical protein FJ134_16830 [Deltaproteobacteria bacterium]|nr:hypothetical protein [Deltaproteobacteria bacterium]